MANIIEKLPFFTRETATTAPDGSPVLVKDNQIVLWVSLGLMGKRAPRCSRRDFLPLSIQVTHLHSLCKKSTFWTGEALISIPFPSFDTST